MVKVNYIGRLGNNLFQYALGRILSEKLGLFLEADPIPGFPETFKRVDGRKIESGPEWVFGGQEFPVSQISALKQSGQRLVLNGFFQRIQYYVNDSKAIRRWFTLDKNIRFPVPSDDELVVHIRLGDIVQYRSHSKHDYVPFFYLARQIRRMECKRLRIVTDSPNEADLIEFARAHKAQVQALSPIEDFGTIVNAKNLILSVSTFAWWGGWLSDAKRIHLPLYGIWNPWIRSGIDLVPYHDSRYEVGSKFLGTLQLARIPAILFRKLTRGVH